MKDTTEVVVSYEFSKKQNILMIVYCSMIIIGLMSIQLNTYWSILIGETFVTYVSLQLSYYGIKIIILSIQPVKRKIKYIITISCIVSMAIILFGGLKLPSLYRDIPYAVNKQYAEVRGIVIEKTETGKTIKVPSKTKFKVRTLKTHREITLLYLHSQKSVKKGEFVRIQYLPNSKIIKYIYNTVYH
ncbi:hypothetical protein [Clostridium sp. JNZ J1-5]